jgi:hypothetical protein
MTRRSHFLPERLRSLVRSLLLISCLGPPQVEGDGSPSGGSTPSSEERLASTRTHQNVQEVEDFSLIAIIADPRRFHGRRVRVMGFVKVTGDDCIVAFNRDSIKYDIDESCIYLDLSVLPKHESDQFKGAASGRCCILEGVVDANRLGPGVGGDRPNACAFVVKHFTLLAVRD